MQVAIFDGFEVTDALAPFDALKLAGTVGAPIETTLVTVHGEEEVTALDDVRVKPTAAFDASADVLLVPGAPALWRSGVTPPSLAEALAAFREPGKLLLHGRGLRRACRPLAKPQRQHTQSSASADRRARRSPATCSRSR